MSTFVLALALQCFFPLFDNPASRPAGMSIVNADQNQDYRLTVYSSAGTPAGTAQLTLAAQTQKAFMLTELISAPLPASGWVGLESATGACSSVLTVEEGGTLAAAEGTAVTERSLIAPHVEINTGFVELEHTDTSIFLVNPDTMTATITIDLVDLKGGVVGSVTKSVAPQGAQEFRVSQAFSNVLPANGLGGYKFDGYIRLNSDVGIAAWQRVETPLARSILLARPAASPASNVYLPHFAFGGTYGSILNIINTGSTPLDLEISAKNDQGNLMGEAIRLTLAVGEGRRALVDGFFRIPVIAIYPPPLVTGFIRIREINGRNFQVAGNIELFDIGAGGRQTLMLARATNSAGTSIVLPFAVTYPEYFTGFVVINPDSLLTVQTDVLVDFVAPDGTVLDRTAIQLSPGARSAKLATVPGKTGYLRFASSLPIHVLGSVGAADHQTLEAIPAVR